MPSSAKFLQAKSQHFDFVSTTASLCMAYVKSNYWLSMENFSTGRHYLTQTDIKVDISNIGARLMHGGDS